MSVDGSKVKASGEVKPVTTPWTEYDSKNNTGHFVPIQTPAICKDQDITIENRKDGDRTVQVDDDLLLVVRLENLNSDKMPVKMDGKDLMTVDFSGAIPTGEDAIDPTKEDFGRFGKKADYVEGISIEWNGVKGIVRGTIKHNEANTKVKAGHHYPLSLCAYYGDGIQKDVIVGAKKTTVKDKDIICDVATARAIKVEYNGYTVLELDLSRAVFA